MEIAWQGKQKHTHTHTQIIPLSMTVIALLCIIELILSFTQTAIGFNLKTDANCTMISTYLSSIIPHIYNIYYICINIYCVKYETLK